MPIGRTRKWREGFAARIFFAEAQTLFQCQPKQNFPLEELLSVELWGVCLTLLARYGGVETARRLIASAQKTGNLSEGLSTLWSCGRLDLSMEESVCKPEYAALFSETEIMYCKNILRELGR